MNFDSSQNISTDAQEEEPQQISWYKVLMNTSNELYTRVQVRNITHFVISYIFYSLIGNSIKNFCQKEIVCITLEESIQFFVTMSSIFMILTRIGFPSKTSNKYRLSSKVIYVVLFGINDIIISTIVVVTFWKGAWYYAEYPSIFISGCIFTLYLVLALIYDMIRIRNILK